MDNLAHTLVGASLAQAGLKRLTPLATATLVIGANLPDVDALATFGGGDFSLCVRRGWTHGVLALGLWPFVLTAAILVLDRIRRSRHRDAAPVKTVPVFLLSVLGILSHPTLDWLNTYGVRLLMPFSERWFYGNALFIVDPWLWLVLGTGVVLGTTSRMRGIVGWSIVGVATSAMMLTMEEVVLPARVIWVAGVAAIVLARLSPTARTRTTSIARWCLGAIVIYIMLMIVGSRIATSYVERWLDQEGMGHREIVAGPVPVNPVLREVIVVREDRYSFYKVQILTGSLQPYGPEIPINGPTAITRAAFAAPQVRGLRAWARFPAYEVETSNDGYRVRIRDVRYSRLGVRARGIGEAIVELDAQLQPRLAAER